MKVRLLSAFVFSLTLTAGASAQQAPATPPSSQAPSQSLNQLGGQGQGGRGGRGGWGGGMMGGRGTIGTVTAVAADHYTIKTENGETYTIHYSVNTRILKQVAGSGQPGQRGGSGEGGERTPPQPIKPTDIKVGDAIAAMGETDATAKSVGAVTVVQIDPERARQMREMQANYGKTWLAGKITAIDGVKVTILGMNDNAAHSFVADENTTFRKRREPITLGDIQVGDAVRVEGAVKDGSFLATTVNAMTPPPEGSVPRSSSPQQ
ncbi:MAG: DUF5666 domain-containing protein [Terracidiphilus sp.]